MHRVALVLVALLAGCASSDAPPTTTPTADPTPTPDGAAEDFAGVDVSHDFTQAAASGTFTIPPGAGSLRLRVWQEPRDPSACATVDARVAVFDPAGALVSEAAAGGREVVVMPSGACVEAEEVVGALAAGEWRIEFEGSGLTVGRVVVERA